MSLGGLGLKAVQLRLQKRTTICSRCGLRYPKESEKCIHCGDLGEQELQELLSTVKEQRESNRDLGVLFLTIAVLIGIGVVLLL